MTNEQLRVRRWLQVALLLALAAPAAFIAIALADTPAARHPPPPIFPGRLRLADLSARPLTLVASSSATADTTGLSWTVPARPGASAFLAARCSAGSMSIRIGHLTTSVPCTGVPVAVGSFVLPGRVRLVAQVPAVQRSRWGVALYAST